MDLDLEKDFSAEDGRGLENQPSSICDDLWDFSTLPPVDSDEVSRLLDSLDFSSLPLDFDVNFSKDGQGLHTPLLFESSSSTPPLTESSSSAVLWDFSTPPLDFDIDFSEGGQGLHDPLLMEASSSAMPWDLSTLPPNFGDNFLEGGQGLRNPLLMESSSSVNPSDLSSLPLDFEVDSSDGEQALPHDSQEQSDSTEEDAESDLEVDMDSMLTDFDLKLILQERELYKQERDALLQRLKDTGAQIKKLQRDYAEINNKSRRSPILQLPVEMIRLIFAYTQGPSYSRGQSVSFFEQSEPLAEVVISHVCHIWRLIALDYAELWTRFRFDASQAQCVPLERFEAYMQRSKLLPVELYLNFEGFDEDEEDDDDDDFADELLVLLESTMKYTERWKLFFVVTNEDAVPILTTLQKLADASVPNLEYLGYLNGNDCSDFEEDLGKTIFMKGAPKLKSVTFDISVADHIIPPLQNITTLCLEDRTWERRLMEESLPWQTFVGMASLPWLTNLSLLGWVVEDPPVFSEPLEMKRLENLRFGKVDYFLMFQSPLKAPVLKTLTIALLYYDLHEDSPEPTSFPSLESLCLINTRSTVTAWRDIAKLTKSIKHLTLINEDYDETCFAFLRSGEAFWTNLKSITMDIGGLGDREVELEAFLIVRRNPNLELSIRRHVLQQWESRTSSKGETSARWDLLCRLKPVPDDFGIEPAVWQDHLSWINLQADDDEDDEETGSESE